MKSWLLLLCVAVVAMCAMADVRVTKFHNPLCIGRGEPITFSLDETTNDTMCVPYFDGMETGGENGTLPLGYLESSQCDASQNFSFTLSKDENCTTLGDEFFVGLPGECNKVLPTAPEPHDDDRRRLAVRRLVVNTMQKKRSDCKNRHGDHCDDDDDDERDNKYESMTVSCEGDLPEFHDWIEIEVCVGDPLPEPTTIPVPVGTEEPTINIEPLSLPPLTIQPISTQPVSTEPLPVVIEEPTTSTIPTAIQPLGVEPTEPYREPTVVVEPLAPVGIPPTTAPPCGCTGKMTQTKTWLDVEGCQRVCLSGDLPSIPPHHDDKRHHKLSATSLPTNEYVLVPTNRSCPADGEPYTISFFSDANCSLETKQFNATVQGCTTNDANNVLMYCSGRNTTIPTPSLEPSVLPPDNTTEPDAAPPTSNTPLEPSSQAPESSLAYSTALAAISISILLSLL